MCKKKYRIISDKNGEKDYNRLDDWKEVFKPQEDRGDSTIGDMPE